MVPPTIAMHLCAFAFIFHTKDPIVFERELIASRLFAFKDSFCTIPITNHIPIESTHFMTIENPQFCLVCLSGKKNVCWRLKGYHFKFNWYLHSVEIPFLSQGPHCYRTAAKSCLSPNKDSWLLII